MTRSAFIFCSLFVVPGCTSLDVLGSRGADELSPEVPAEEDAPNGELPDGLSTVGESPEEQMVEEDPPPSAIPNILMDRINAPLAVVNKQLDGAFEQLFFGNPDSEAVYRDQGDGSAYIEDVYHKDVRTDSMGYGMMVAVQLDRREVFDKLWTWAIRYMRNDEGPSKGLLSWNCSVDGDDCRTSASTDALSIIVTALYLAEDNWGPAGEHEYAAEANALLDAMTQIEENSESIAAGIFNCFDMKFGLPRHGSTNPTTAVPVDYLMPAFYEYWAEKRSTESEFWLRVAENSRNLLSLISNSTTGLYPESIDYSGMPVPGALDYRGNSSRALFNLALDHLRFGPYSWVSQQNERLLDFFLMQGVNSYAAEYSVTGEPLVTFNTPAHRSMVALAAGTTLKDRHDPFLQGLLDEATPSGPFRYYDGMLYLLSLLVLSGQFEME